jgi:hypothetical protein
MRAEDCSKQQGGFILVVVALVLVSLVGFVALGVDVGVLYSARTSAQAVADSAALAGAFTFISQPSAPQPSTATTHAIQLAVNNAVMGVAVNPADVNVAVDVANRRVTVDVASVQQTYFAPMLGQPTANIGVRAIAEASRHSTGAGPCGVKPWFVSNTILSTQGACAACNSNEVITSGGNATQYALNQLGQQFTVKPQDPSGAIGPGNFYAIELPPPTGQQGCGGACAYEANIANDCFTNPIIVQCQQSYSVKTGNMVGPTKHGVDALIGNPPTDLYHSVGVYGPQSGPYSDMSKALVLAPIWDTCGSGLCPAGSFGNGTNVTLTVIGFAVFFLEGTQGQGNNADVIARLINVSSCAPSNPGGGQTGGSVLSMPLRLVRLP